MDINFSNIKILDAEGMGLDLVIKCSRNDSVYDFELVNSGATDVRISKIYLFDGKIPFDIKAEIYGEGYQSGAQYKGNSSAIYCLTDYDDDKHYKMPSEKGFKTLYNYITVKDKGIYRLIGAVSCNAFRTEISINSENLKITQSLENKTVKGGETFKLESITIVESQNLTDLMQSYSNLISLYHPKKNNDFRFLGWSPLHCYGTDITFDEFTLNMSFAKKYIPDLNLIMIENGYQPFMGDWLLPIQAPNKDAQVIGIDSVIKEILKEGFKAGIWIAPFIASSRSDLYKNHPDYFIKDELDYPLSSGQNSYGGWIDTPWYILDFTNPKTCEYIKKVFTIMYKDWGVRYFELDALMWGAMPYGIRYDNNKTSIESYRMGIKTILECLGDDAYVEGINAPLFPSLGLFDSMKLVTDNDRYFLNFKAVKEQLENRLWQNDKLWSINPDHLLMISRRKNFLAKGKLHFKKDFKLPSIKYGIAAMRISGGNIITGDKIYALTDYDIGIINKLNQLPHVSAVFNDDKTIATIKYDKTTEYLIFNDNSKFMKKSIKLNQKSTIINMFNDKKMESDTLEVSVLPKSAAWYKVI